MFKRSILVALAASLLAAPALANDVYSFQTSEDFQDKLEETYGERELSTLTEKIQKDISRELGKVGVAPARIDVTILDAKPNRPTFEQIGRNGLSFQSFGIGGMDLKAVAYGANDEVIGELEYGWFENDIRWAQNRATWSDARRASRIFARKFAKTVAG